MAEVTLSELQEAAPIRTKLDENEHLGASVSIILGVNLDPRTTIMVSLVPKNASQRHPKSVLGRKCDPLQQTPCRELLAARRIHFQLSPISSLQ